MKIGDLPQAIDKSTLCGNLVCGGSDFQRSCFLFDGVGTFKALSVTLIERREMHLCWALPSGDVLLLGGMHGKAPLTTERVSADGLSSEADFGLPYRI